MNIDNSYLCQICGQVKPAIAPPTWQQITLPDGRTFHGNVCPTCNPDAETVRKALHRPDVSRAHHFNAAIRVRFIRTLNDGTVLAETADEFDKGTQIRLAPDQIRENA